MTRLLGPLAILWGLGCGAVYPEIVTPIRPARDEPATPGFGDSSGGNAASVPSDELSDAPSSETGTDAAAEGDSAPAEPAVSADPPSDFYYIYVEEASIPARTRDGREWAGGTPSSFAKILKGRKELLRTPVQSKTRSPTWPDQGKFNYQLAAGEELILEVWVADPIKDLPICHIMLRDLDHIRDGGRNDFDCDSGARVTVAILPARHVTGLGFYYELRGAEGVRVTRILRNSPASRLGLKVGDSIVRVNEKPVKGMDALTIQSTVNSSSRTGLMLEIQPKGGAIKKLSIKEGPIYPLKEDGIPLDPK